MQSASQRRALKEETLKTHLCAGEKLQALNSRAGVMIGGLPPKFKVQGIGWGQ